MAQEVIFFLALTACGAAIAFLLDIFRAFRIAVRPSSAAVAVSDVLFCAGAMFIALACVWNLNSGIFRFYEIVGIILGAILYFSSISKWILRFFVFVFRKILKFIKIICKILLTPLSFLYKILVVPVKNKIRKDNGTYGERIQGQNH